MFQIICFLFIIALLIGFVENAAKDLGFGFFAFLFIGGVFYFWPIKTLIIGFLFVGLVLLNKFVLMPSCQRNRKDRKKAA